MHISTLALWMRYFCLVKSIRFMHPCRSELKGWNGTRERVGRSESLWQQTIKISRQRGGTKGRASAQNREGGWTAYRWCAWFDLGGDWQPDMTVWFSDTLQLPIWYGLSKGENVVCLPCIMLTFCCTSQFWKGLPVLLCWQTLWKVTISNTIPEN